MTKMNLTIDTDEPECVGMTKLFDIFALNNTQFPRF